jgi:hypothetical protein
MIIYEMKTQYDNSILFLTIHIETSDPKYLKIKTYHLDFLNKKIRIQ